MALSIKVEGLDQLKKSFKRSPEFTKRIMSEAMDLSVMRLKNTAKSKAPVDTGRLRNSIRDKVSFSIRSITGVVDANVKYAPFVEFGRRKGKAPPASALRVWARKRGINEFALAKSIARKGVKAQPFMQPAVRQNEVIIGRIFNSAMGALIKNLAK